MRWEPPARGPWRRKEAVFWSLALQCQIDGGCGRAAFHHQGNARAGHDPALQRPTIAQRSYGLAIDLGADVAGLKAGLLEARPPRRTAQDAHPPLLHPGDAADVALPNVRTWRSEERRVGH